MDEEDLTDFVVMDFSSYLFYLLWGRLRKLNFSDYQSEQHQQAKHDWIGEAHF